MLGAANGSMLGGMAESTAVVAVQERIEALLARLPPTERFLRDGQRLIPAGILALALSFPLEADQLPSRAGSDGARAGSDGARAGSDEARAGSDGARAGSDEARADPVHLRRAEALPRPANGHPQLIGLLVELVEA